MVYNIKVIIIGDPGVGKTSLVSRYITAKFAKDYKATIGTNIFSKKLELSSSEPIGIQIWDIAGQERWTKVRSLYYKGTHGIIMVGDITRKTTFDNLVKFWLKDIQMYCKEKPIILLANKSDLDSEISSQEIQEIEREINPICSFHTSAKEGTNVESAFKNIAEEASKR